MKERPKILVFPKRDRENKIKIIKPLGKIIKFPGEKRKTQGWFE